MDNFMNSLGTLLLTLVRFSCVRDGDLRGHATGAHAMIMLLRSWTRLLGLLYRVM